VAYLSPMSGMHFRIILIGTWGYFLSTPLSPILVMQGCTWFPAPLTPIWFRLLPHGVGWCSISCSVLILSFLPFSLSLHPQLQMIPQLPSLLEVLTMVGRNLICKGDLSARDDGMISKSQTCLDVYNILYLSPALSLL
jgi:hypothetical protein